MKLRYGMVGGGPVALSETRTEKQSTLTGSRVGCRGISNYEIPVTARQLHIPEDRCYKDYNEMAVEEAKREDGIDFVSIVTPNHMHYPSQRLFLRRINVACDKPLCLNPSRQMNCALQMKRVCFS